MCVFNQFPGPFAPAILFSLNVPARNCLIVAICRGRLPLLPLFASEAHPRQAPILARFNAKERWSSCSVGDSFLRLHFGFELISLPRCRWEDTISRESRFRVSGARRSRAKVHMRLPRLDALGEYRFSSAKETHSIAHAFRYIARKKWMLTWSGVPMKCLCGKK